MARIYANAHVTIAASAAKYPSEGCFHNTHWSHIGQPLPGYSGVHIRQALRYTSHEVNIDAWPLLGRGWVFQELSLSPRILHFGFDEVMWQCRSTRACEGRGNAMNVDPYHVILPSAWPEPFIEITRLHWCRIVEAYSWRTVTFSKDRLPALAAMATRTQINRLHDRYIAGVWQSTLCFDLM